MPWFQKLCRQTGLAIHRATKPAGDDGQQRDDHGPKVVIRRTTIEEIEVREPPPEPDFSSRS